MLGFKQQLAEADNQGCNIPWAILMDPTSACNLKCTGCWAAEYGNRLNMTYEELDSIITQVNELGTYFFLFSGGEPIVRKKDVIRLCENHPDCQFSAFTNGTLIDEEFADEMLRVKNFIEPFTVGCRAARRSNPKKNEKAVVFGCGTIGIAAATALKYFGIEKVMICDYSALRLNIAEELGFEVCNMETDDLITKAKAYLGEARSLKGKTADIDIMLDAAGAESVFENFMEHGKIESRFVSVAVNKAIRELDMLHLTYSQKSIIGSGGYMPDDVNDVINIMKSGRWDIGKLITHEYPLSQLEAAICKASDVNEALNVTIKFD